MIYSIDNTSSLQDLLQCMTDKSFVVSSFTEGKLLGKLNGQETQFVVAPEFIKDIPVSKYDKLIYGKDQTENIVSVEIKDNQLIKFIEVNGVVTTVVEPYKFWLITENLLNKNKQYKLAGEQPLKWMTEYEDYNDWKKAKGNLWGREEYYCVNNLKEQAMIRHGITYFKGMEPKQVSILSFDIETAGLSHNKDSKVYCITNTIRKNNKVVQKDFFLEDYNEDDGEMIKTWCSWVREENPSILLGHNIISFDLLYLDFRSKSGLSLGRDGSIMTVGKKPRQFRKDGSQSYEYYEPSIFGREVVDTFFLSLQYDIGRKYDSYGLKSIIKAEGLEKPDRTFIDASKIKYYYDNRHIDVDMWNNVKKYASEDSQDSLKLFDMMIPAKFYFTQNVSKSFQEMGFSATGSQINVIMTRSYVQEEHSVAKADEVVPFQGAHSLGIPGVYRNCVRWDAASLYPSIMRQLKLYHSIKDPNANFFKITEYFALERLKNKQLAKETKLQYYKDLEQSQKVAANSLYGFLSATGLNYNYPEGAAAITRRGRELLEKMVFWASGKTVEEMKGEKDVPETPE